MRGGGGRRTRGSRSRSSTSRTGRGGCGYDRLHHTQPVLGQVYHAQTAGGEVNAEDTGQHEGTTEEGENNVFYRRILFSPRTPDRNQEIHRYDLYLPEDEEQKQVQGAEHPQNAGLQK